MKPKALLIIIGSIFVLTVIVNTLTSHYIKSSTPTVIRDVVESSTSSPQLDVTLGGYTGDYKAQYNELASQADNLKFKVILYGKLRNVTLTGVALKENTGYKLLRLDNMHSQ